MATRLNGEGYGNTMEKVVVTWLLENEQAVLSTMYTFNTDNLVLFFAISDISSATCIMVDSDFQLRNVSCILRGTRLFVSSSRHTLFRVQLFEICSIQVSVYVLHVSTFLFLLRRRSSSGIMVFSFIMKLRSEIRSVLQVFIIQGTHTPSWSSRLL